MTFAARLAAERPAELAVRGPDGDFTWAQADAWLRPLVAYLQSLDLGPQRRVAIIAENSAHTLLCYAAATLAGASAVAVNSHLEPAEAAYQVGHSGAHLVLTDAASATRASRAAELGGVAAVWSSAEELPDLGEPSTAVVPRPTMVYTSGTTGRPKGVELPPTSWVGGADIDEHLTRLAQNSMVAYGRHLVVGPLYHSGPLTGTRLFLGGAPVTVLGKFDPERFLATVARDRVGSTIVVPTHLQRLLALPAEVRGAYDLSSLHFVLQVGAKCPAPVKAAAIDWLGDALFESYGASEVGTTAMISAAEWLARPSSVGRAVPPFEAVILDEEDVPVEPGVEGRLYFRDCTGHGIRYTDGADATGPDGLFTLGEIGLMDADGYVWITDRASDLVVSGGVNIYPAEAEAVLARHPDVAEVACLGLPHPDLGEQLVAFVVPADPAAPPAPDSLITYCRSHLSLFKCPRRLELVDHIPRTPVGKLDKRALRTSRAP
ncbi:MAG: AMP-binding protein [Sporichthyaceae bacterium]